MNSNHTHATFDHVNLDSKVLCIRCFETPSLLLQEVLDVPDLSVDARDGVGGRGDVARQVLGRGGGGGGGGGGSKDGGGRDGRVSGVDAARGGGGSGDGGRRSGGREGSRRSLRYKMPTSIC